MSANNWASDRSTGSVDVGSGTIATALAAFVALGAAGAIYGPALPEIIERHDVTASAGGLVLAAHGAGAFAAVAVCLVPAVEKGLRFRPALALASISIGAVAIAAPFPWPILLLGAFGVGIGYGLLTIGLNGLFARAFGARSGVMVNLLNASFGIGAVATPFLFVRLGGSMEIGFGLLALLAAALILPALVVDDRTEMARPATGAHEGAGAKGGHLAALALMFLAVGTETSLIGWGPTVLIATGAEADVAAGAASWFFVVFLTARLIAVPLAAWLDFRTIAIATVSLLAVLAIGAALTDEPYGWFVAMGVVGAVFPNAFGWLSSVMRSIPGANARIVLAALLGATIVPLALGPIADRFGSAVLFVPIASCWTVTIVTAYAVRTADGVREGA